MTTSTCWQQPVRPVAHIGFGCGWLVLAPTFLNFGLPAVLVDSRLVQDTNLRLEPFANHDPSLPWREADACLRYSPGTLELWRLRPEQLIAAEFQAGGTAVLARHDRVILLVGNSYDVQLSWSALFDCLIGACDLQRRG